MRSTNEKIEVDINELNKVKSHILNLEDSKYLLKRDLEWFLKDYISNQPKKIQEILKMRPKEDVYKWESKIINELIKLIESRINVSDFMGMGKASYCPLCENGLNKMPKTLADGYKVPVGLKRHLEGTHGANQCIVIKTLFNLVKNR